MSVKTSNKPIHPKNRCREKSRSRRGGIAGSVRCRRQHGRSIFGCDLDFFAILDYNMIKKQIVTRGRNRLCYVTVGPLEPKKKSNNELLFTSNVPSKQDSLSRRSFLKGSVGLAAVCARSRWVHSTCGRTMGFPRVYSV